MENHKEIRYVASVRAGKTDRIISGTAIVFDKESKDLGGFTEIIKREAVSDELITKSNIVMLFNHDDDMIPLARSKNGTGSLEISVTDTGVDFKFTAKETPIGDEILAAVRSGDVDSCSFAFYVADDGDDWMSKPDGGYLRTITQFEELFDFSLVNNPAYADAQCRSFDKFRESREKPVEPPPPQPNVQQQSEPVEPPPPDPGTNTDQKVLDEHYKQFDEVITTLHKD
jgi:HK97 family phage prohead protease